MGLDGLLYSFPVSDIMTFIIAVIVICYTYKELRAGEPAGKMKKAANG